MLKWIFICIYLLTPLISANLFAGETGSLKLSGRVDAMHTINTSFDLKNHTLLFEHLSNNNQPLIVQIKSQRELQTEILRTSKKVNLGKYYSKEKKPSIMTITITSSV